MVQQSLSSLLKEIRIKKIHGNTDISVNGITYDSRRVEPGHIYTALPGFHTDGHKFIDEAIQKGATAIVHEKEIKNHTHNVAYIKVDQIRAVLSTLSSAFYNHPSRNLAVIGVTGTDGKSTTVWFIHQLLKALGEKSGFLSTVHIKTDNIIMKNPLRQSTPEAPEMHSLLYNMMQAGKNFAVIEATSHGLSDKTKRLADVEFDIAVATNVTHEHLEFHGSFEQYRSDKANLFRMLDKNSKEKSLHTIPFSRCGIVNDDDPGSGFFKTVTKKNIYTYSLKNKNADLYAHSFTPYSRGTQFSISCNNNIYRTFLNIPGLIYIEDLMAASLAICKLLNVHISDIISFIPELKGVTGRMNPVQEGQDFNVIVDYAHTPSSFEKILPMIRELTKGNLIAVFGSAGERDIKKRPVQGKIASQYADFIILTDEDPRLEDPHKILEDIAAGCFSVEKGKNLFLESDRRKAIMLAYSLAGDKNDTVLLLGKGHESSIIYADGPVPWNEIEIAKNILKKMGFSRNK